VSSAQVGTLIVRGCTSSGDRYEVNLGQRSQKAGGAAEWQLTLENVGNGALDYRVEILPDETNIDAASSTENWLSVTPMSGRLQPMNRQALVIAVSTSRLGIFSTYVLIENTKRSGDVKLIR